MTFQDQFWSLSAAISPRVCLLRELLAKLVKELVYAAVGQHTTLRHPG